MPSLELPHYDGFFIELRVGDPRFGDPPRGWVAAQLPSCRVNLTQLNNDIEALTMAPPAGELGVDNFRSEITAGHTSWGADGSMLTAILDIGGGVAAERLLRAMGRLIKKYRSNQYRHDWTDDELIRHARTMLAKSLHVSHDHIDAIGIERAPGSEEATIRFTANRKLVAVTVRMINGVAVVAKLDRDL